MGMEKYKWLIYRLTKNRLKRAELSEVNKKTRHISALYY